MEHEKNYDFLCLTLFHELSLLYRTGIPLYECLRYIADRCPDPSFRAVLRNLGDLTQNDTSLSKAMEQYPHVFQPYQIQVLRAGENSDDLLLSLKALSHATTTTRNITRKVSEIITVSSISIVITISILFGVLFLIVPRFATMFDEMLAGEPLPFLTHLVLAVSFFIRENGLFLGILLILAISVLSMYIRQEYGSYDHYIYQIVRRFGSIQKYTDNARFAGTWGLFLRMNLKDEEICRNLTTIFQGSAFSKTLSHWKDYMGSRDQWIATDSNIDPLIKLTLRRSTSADYANALSKVAHILYHRTYLSTIW